MYGVSCLGERRHQCYEVTMTTGTIWAREFEPQIRGLRETWAAPSKIPLESSDIVGFSLHNWCFMSQQKRETIDWLKDNVKKAFVKLSILPAEKLLMDFHTCILFIVEVFQQMFIFALSRILNKKEKSLETVRSTQRKHHTTQLHPYFPKNAMDVILKGEKYILPDTL